MFRVESLVSIVATGQDDVMGSDKLSKERDKLRKRCEVLNWKKSYAVKELVTL